jgi:Methyltransferase domain
MTEPLLHSLTFYADLLRRLAGIPRCPDIVEIGSETGEVSELLARVALARGGTLRVVEPFPSDRLRAVASELGNVEVVEGRSPEALAAMPAAGLYVVDGDHNYVTVRGELEAIFRADDADPLAVLHDIGWPSGRRDQYYAPALLPLDAVHPHSFTRGAVLDRVELGEPGRGFRGEGAFAFALHEGGPRNGVLTAVEDVLAQRPELDLIDTPLVFGLGIVGRQSGEGWPQVVAAMAPYVDNPTLAAAERNRLELLLQLIEWQDRYVPPPPETRVGGVVCRRLGFRR